MEGFAPSQLRYGEGCGKHKAIEGKDLEIDQGIAETDRSNHPIVTRKMKKHVPERSGGKGCRNQTQPRMLLEVPDEGRIEEEVYEQFFEIVVKPVEKFTDRGCRKRTIRVSQGVETCEPTTCDYPMPDYRQRKQELEKGKQLTLPADVPRIRSPLHAFCKCIGCERDMQISVEQENPLYVEKLQNYGPRGFNPFNWVTASCSAFPASMRRR